MHKDDWFRSGSWDEAARLLFQQKLARARGAGSKSQYARIKALSLQQTGDPAKIRAAIGILEHIRSEWPDVFDTSSVLHQLAECAELEGRLQECLDHYAEVFASQRARPGLKTSAHLNYGWLVICHPFPDHYEQALAILDEFHGATPFPVEIFRASAIRAIILGRSGREPARAKELAATALAAARMTEAPLRYHPKSGLVGHVDSDILRELKALA